VFQKKGFTLVLKEVVSDSSPEGLNCIWAGEVTVLIWYTKIQN
jgi:hypothetical protein